MILPSEHPTRLVLLCHGSTDAVREGRFPANEALDQFGVRDCGNAKPGISAEKTRRWSAPERRSVQTLELLGLSGEVDPLLRDCDFGNWTGKSLAEILEFDPEGLQRWLQNSAEAPGGGEAGSAMVQRLGAWMTSLVALGGSHLAVTHAAPMRAALAFGLGCPASQMTHFDIGPLTTVCLAWNKIWRLERIAPWQKNRPLELS